MRTYPRLACCSCGKTIKQTINLSIYLLYNLYAIKEFHFPLYELIRIII